MCVCGSIQTYLKNLRSSGREREERQANVNHFLWSAICIPINPSLSKPYSYSSHPINIQPKRLYCRTPGEWLEMGYRFWICIFRAICLFPNFRWPAGRSHVGEKREKNRGHHARDACENDKQNFAISISRARKKKQRPPRSLTFRSYAFCSPPVGSPGNWVNIRGGFGQ